MRAELDINDESLDKLVVTVLLSAFECDSLEPQTKEDEEICQHLKAVIEYFGGKV